MNFLLDAHLPHRLALWLGQAGHDVVHTHELPLGNRTPDSVINEISVRERRVVITKDEDFDDSFFLYHQPHKLRLVSTGNINNITYRIFFLWISGVLNIALSPFFIVSWLRGLQHNLCPLYKHKSASQPASAAATGP